MQHCLSLNVNVLWEHIVSDKHHAPGNPKHFLLYVPEAYLRHFTYRCWFLNCSVQGAACVGEGRDIPLSFPPSPTGKKWIYFVPLGECGGGVAVQSEFTSSQLGGPLEGVCPKNQDFLGPEMATSETHLHKLLMYLFFIWRLDLMILMQGNRANGLDPFNFFGPKWYSLSSLPFQGPKKSGFSGHTPSNCSHNGFAHIKIAMSRSI